MPGDMLTLFSRGNFVSASAYGTPGLLFKSGRYYGPQFGQLTTGTPNLNDAMAFPFYVNNPAGFTFTNIGFNVTAGGTTSTARIGVWLADPTTGWPTALLYDITGGSPLSTTGTGDKRVTVTKTLPPGRYWIGALHQGGAAPTVSAVVSINPGLSTPAVYSGGNIYPKQSGQSAGLPNPLVPDGINFAPYLDMLAA